MARYESPLGILRYLSPATGELMADFITASSLLICNMEDGCYNRYPG